MRLSQDVIDRLLVAKGLLAKIRFSPTAHPDRISLAQAILSAHDAAELASAAIARHLNCLPAAQKTYLMDILPANSKSQGVTVAHRDYFSQLNSVRKVIKHEGIFPDTQQWYRVGERVYEYLSEWCQQYLGLSLDKLDESALIRNEEVKEWHRKAKEALERGQYRESLEYLAFATEALFRSNQALRNLSIGKPVAEDAIKLAAFGVHANDYLALQEFLPSLVYKRVRGQSEMAVKWEQEKYGHPGNWTKYAAEFSLKTFVDVAIRIQDADWIPGAIEFTFLYEHKITALEDGVKITQEKKPSALKDVIKPESVVIRTLKKNESLRCNVSVKSSPKNYLANLLGIGTENPILFIVNVDEQLYGEVEAKKVMVTCVPKDNEFVNKYFPNLPEVDFYPSIHV